MTINSPLAFLFCFTKEKKNRKFGKASKLSLPELMSYVVIDIFDFLFTILRSKELSGARLWSAEILAQHIIRRRAARWRFGRRNRRDNYAPRTLSVFWGRTSTAKRDNATGKWCVSALSSSKLRREDCKPQMNKYKIAFSTPTHSISLLYKVSWVRRKGDQLHLITFGESLYSSDSRYSLKFKSPNDWQLHIQYANKRDEGQFECQINTSPTLVFIVYLIVVGK